MSDDKPWLNGKPYYCRTCGLGMAEYQACEDGDCELESEEEARLRKVNNMPNAMFGGKALDAATGMGAKKEGEAT